ASLWSIVLAVVGRQIFGNPLKFPSGGPRLRVCARIVDGDLVFQCVEIGASEALNHVKLLGMRQPAVSEPELLVEHLGIDDERISVPRASRVAIVQRIVSISSSVARLRTAICINEVPIVVPATLNQKNASEVFILEKLNSVRHLELTY